MSSCLESLVEEFRKHSPTVDRWFSYGTAGFRSIGDDMRHVIHRSAMLLVLLSVKSNKQVAGLCITASHNPPQDNGVKLINSDGGMLDSEFETYATEYINARDPMQYLVTLCDKLGICLSNPSVFSESRIYCGRDTRDSSPQLHEYAKSGIEALGATFLDLGVVTTPQVHFAVQTANHKGVQDLVGPTEYYNHFAQQFSDFFHLCGLSSHIHPRYSSERLVCDGANGVGSRCIGNFYHALKQHTNVSLEIRNDGTWPDDQLNFLCGTEYVQKEMKIPKRFGGYTVTLCEKMKERSYWIEC